MDNTYRIASKYENFIRTAFNCDVNKHGAHLSYMQNVMFMEQGKTCSKHLGSLEKQFAKVQGYIEKALLHLVEGSTSSDDDRLYKSLLIQLHHSTNTTELMAVVATAFDNLLDCKKKIDVYGK